MCACDNLYKPLEGVPIVTGDTAQDYQANVLTYILIFNKAIYYGTKLENSLIKPTR